MADREQIRRQTARSDEEVEQTEELDSESGQAIKDEIDDLLDEIDDVLETNAEDFVKSYIQKGGQ